MNRALLKCRRFALKSRSTFSKILIFGSPLLFLVLLFGFRQLRHDYLYPTSSEFINPYNGRPDPELCKYVLPFVSKNQDLVSIDLGSVPGDVIKLAALQYLSPVVRMNPEAREFHITWSVLYPRYNRWFDLTYNRQTGDVLESQEDLILHTPSIATKIGTSITDRDIHNAATSNKDYDVWTSEHWKQ